MADRPIEAEVTEKAPSEAEETRGAEDGAFPKRRLGVWIVGARGGVATTMAVGWAALARGEAPTTGLVTEGSPFDSLGWVGWDQMVLGGHEVRSGNLADAARELERQQGALPPGSADRYAEELAAIDARIRPGVLYQSGSAIDRLAEERQHVATNSPRQAIDHISADLAAFREANRLDRVVVVLLGSTEPPVEIEELPDDWDSLARRLKREADCPLRSSSLYAIAAIESGSPLVNFTPSRGADCPAIEKLSKKIGVPHCGRDGKTGETLIKSVLAPMFAARQLEVQSWVSHNLLGNRDGAILAEAENKRAKIESKQQLLEELLGYQPENLVSIEPIASLGDWKTAWNNVHFKGFLGVPMTLQFTWQGCDSALAAPLVLDLVRLIDRAAERGESGAISELGAFFKSPMGGSPHAFAEQTERLIAWAQK